MLFGLSVHESVSTCLLIRSVIKVTIGYYCFQLWLLFLSVSESVCLCLWTAVSICYNLYVKLILHLITVLFMEPIFKPSYIMFQVYFPITLELLLSFCVFSSIHSCMCGYVFICEVNHVFIQCSDIALYLTLYYVLLVCVHLCMHASVYYFSILQIINHLDPSNKSFY